MYNPTKPYKYKILKLIESTWQTPYVKIERGLYPTVTKKFSFPEVQHTDGIGTKGLYHWQKRTFRNATLDALAMNLNDLAIVRAIPYKLSNHITVPLEDERVFKIIQELVRQCLKYNIAIVGGENSFHNNMDGLDISMTVSGFIKKNHSNKFRVGDVLIGLKSSGLHSNGFTAVRKIFGNIKRPEFIAPTAMYLDTILNLSSKHQINGLMHITGGAFTKLKDILGKANATIEHPKNLLPQKIFYEIYKKGTTNKDMYQTFNCGIGFVLSVPKKEVSAILSKTKHAAIIGEVTPGTGNVKIKSAFDGKTITF